MTLLYHQNYVSAVLQMKTKMTLALLVIIMLSAVCKLFKSVHYFYTMGMITNLTILLVIASAVSGFMARSADKIWDLIED